MNMTGNNRISSHDIDVGEGPLGCYLIHGFTGSTWELQDLADHLATQGYHVQARLLSGHGTTVEECNLARAEDWLQETEYHFTEFMLAHEAVFPIGLSMGAGMALHLAALYPVTGVVAMSPALRMGSWKRRLVVPMMTPFVKTILKERLYSGRNAGNHPFTGYPSYPLRGFREMMRLNKYILSKLPKVKAPALILHSHADITASMESAEFVLEAIQSTDKALVTYQNACHVLPISTEKEAVQQEIVNFITRLTKDQLHEVSVHESR